MDQPQEGAERGGTTAAVWAGKKHVQGIQYLMDNDHCLANVHQWKTLIIQSPALFLELYLNIDDMYLNG